MLKKIRIAGLCPVTPLTIEQVPEGKYWYVANISVGYHAEEWSGETPTGNPFTRPIEVYYTDWDFTGEVYDNTSMLYNEDHSINDRYSKELTKGTSLAEGSSIIPYLNEYAWPPGWTQYGSAPFYTIVSVFEFDNE